LKKEDRAKKARLVLKKLIQVYPDARCALNFHSPEELLVATILSAQCTDVMVNRVTPELFERYPVPEKMAEAPLRHLERIIRPCGYYRQKARYIKESCRKLIESFGGKVPKTIEELLQLPGVARKTANVVLSVAFGINEGIAVDTHVSRIARRLGFTKEKNPERIERELMSLFPRKDWGKLTDVLIAHGRAVCKARRPDCAHCPVKRLCPSAFSVS
jgi:endonuclease-3